MRFCLRSEPKSFHPFLADDTSSELMLYLTSDVLIRVNRLTQKPEPELAQSWKISSDAKSITFQLRPGISFSDGTPFSAADVAYTLIGVTDPKLHSPVGESFMGAVKATVNAPLSVTVTFPAPQANFPALFDTLPILSARSPLKEKAVLGPFVIANYKPGAEIGLKRNPNYWKKDTAGRRLPYLDSVRLYIQANREIEYTRFRRGEVQIINRADPAIFERLTKESPAEARSGTSSDVEFLWFNQMPASPVPAYKREWFRSRNFRQAISEAINRDDISRIVYSGHAQPSLGPCSSANLFWFDKTLKPQLFDSKAALNLLQSEGFQLRNASLYDKGNNPVEFSVVTFGSARERTAVLIQQDLKAIGIKLNIVPLEMNSLIERIKRNFQYEAALLGLSNVDLDPNGQMNVWPSTSGDHAWNPNQKTPDTPWEAEIDRLMQEQSTSTNPNKRKHDFDRVQQIVRQQLPYIYLVNKNVLSAIAISLRSVEPAPLFPEVLWNIDRISLK